MTLRRNILTSWASHAVTLMVGLFLVRFIKDTLGDAGYGAWIFVNSIVGYATLLYFGFGAAVSRYTARHHALRDWPGLNRVLSSIFVIYGINGLFAIAAAGGVAAAAPLLSDWEGQSLREVRVVIVLLGGNAAVGLWGSVFGGVLIGIQRFDVYRSVQIVCTLLRLGLFVAGLHWRPSILSLAVASLAVTAAENLTYFVAARWLVPALRVSPRLASVGALRECFSFTAFNAVVLLSDFLIGLTDTVVIGCVLGTAATVPYYIALRLCQMVQTPLEHVAEVMLPKSAELQTRRQPAELRRLVLRGFGVSLLLLGGVMIGAAYFGDRLIRTWLGPEETDSPAILLVLLGAQLIALPLRVPKMTLLGLGRVRALALFNVVQATANLVLSLILIRHWGVIGVAWGTFLPALVCELGLLVPYTCRVLGLRVRDLLVQGVGPQLLPFAALWWYCEWMALVPWAETWPNLLLITGLGGSVLLAVRGAEHWWSQRWRQRRGMLTGEVWAQ